MRERLIGIDAGGTMTKVALFDPLGNELGCERRPNRMLFPKANWTERDADAMWHATCEAIRNLMEKTNTAPEQIVAITPSGFGAGVFVVDRSGNPVRNGIVSTDSRSSAIIGEWAESGLISDLPSQIQQQIWPGQTLALLSWFSRFEPETVERTAHVLLCKDFLRMRLCGDVSTDPTDAGCAGVVDVNSGSVATGALEQLGLSAWINKLPPVRPSTEVVAGLSDAAAEQTGLLAGTPVARGVYDVVGCALSSGVATSNQLAVVAGTFSINSTLHSRPALNPLPTIQAAYPVAGTFLATSATPTSASNLEWMCKTMLAAEGDRAIREGKSIYDVCNSLVDVALRRDNDILFFPFLFGGPKGAPGGFLGLTADNNLGDVMRAVYEGIVFAHKYDLETHLAGPDAATCDVVRLAGGPSRSDVWAQMFSDGLNLPVEIANGTEFGAKGAAMCGAVASGLYPDVQTAIDKMVVVERRFDPDPTRVEAIEEKYGNYRDAVTSIGAIWNMQKLRRNTRPPVLVEDETNLAN
ncbi:FGGY-family carbohydrate kinase [Phyllobacterium lublinensis]|uniref:FGGY-family carbohydrate kinase n=1 Tax=Phyllobacterium lublinensis TaxID=2875708 RepID=UPI001CCF980A|nr:FGGY-family carbohydrate kinase [Phyllobacterium sp. 2063]MBZ9655261.1 carbohydrate kinase [Phyllobacterium sp. 2063]